jgi:transcriptional regulator with XRE-family HTH domain
VKFDVNKYEFLIASKCLSEKELSEISGVGRATLSQIKNNIRKPMPKTVGRIAKALEVKVEELVLDSEVRKGVV